MSDVKWIKLFIGFFDDEKIKAIIKMNNGKSVVLFWLKLLILAGKTNDDGQIYLSENVPYTAEGLADVTNDETDIVETSLGILQKYGMIDVINGTILIENWEKHQNTNGLDKIREQTKKRVRKHRELKKKIADNVQNQDCNALRNVTVTLQKRYSNANVTQQIIEEDKEQEQDTEQTVTCNALQFESVPAEVDYCSELISFFNTLDFAKVAVFSDLRKSRVKKLLKEYGFDRVKEVFLIANSSDFLTGRKPNKNDWKANFDWLINPANFIKVMEGQYSQKQKKNENVDWKE